MKRQMKEYDELKRELDKKKMKKLKLKKPFLIGEI